MKRRGWFAAALMMGAVASLGAVGCMDGESAPDASQVKAGIYSLYANPVSDSCGPRASSGELGKVVVQVEGSKVKANVSPYLDDSDGYLSTYFMDFDTSGDARAERSSPMPEVCGGGGTLWRDQQELVSTEAGLLVRSRREWSISCPAGVLDRLGPDIPLFSCTTELDLFYQLETACEAPCEVHRRGGGELYCSCADVI